MIRIKEKGYRGINVIPMGDMKPLQVGIICDVDESHDGQYVMRTASEMHSEVLNLSRAKVHSCWTDLSEGHGQKFGSWMLARS